jgi:endonuclease/exonuclease/phosphatase family metal-dependent hydrolase
MGGDFNLGDIAWESEVPYVTNPNTTAQHIKLLQVLDDSSFTQHVKVPTRPASGKTLDLLFSSYPNSVSNVSTQSGMSDHLPVLFDIHTKPTRSLSSAYMFISDF